MGYILTTQSSSNAFMPFGEAQRHQQKTQIQTKSVCKTTINTKATSTNRNAKFDQCCCKKDLYKLEW